MDKRKFITAELWILSWNASVQRANIYADSGVSESRKVFRDSVIDYAESYLIPVYKDPVNENRHLQSILSLSDFGTQSGHLLLTSEGYRIGIAQKLLNLQLKYLWCLSLIPEPPHCPIDRIILGKTALKDAMNWTEISTIEDYQRAIDAVRTLADSRGLSIAEWELQVYDRRQ